MGIISALFTPVEQDQLGGAALRFLGLLPEQTGQGAGETDSDPGLETVKN